jgi:hypothetical protein
MDLILISNLSRVASTWLDPDTLGMLAVVGGAGLIVTLLATYGLDLSVGSF